MAKATDKSTASAAKPRASRGKAGAATPNETGAPAPVSAGAAKEGTQDSDVVIDGHGGAAWGMGRFPDDWAPARTEETVQTPAVEASDAPLQSPAWGLPEVSEFPATLTLVNKTPSRVRVLSFKAWVLPWSQVTVQCNTAEQYQALGRDLAPRAHSCRWNSDKGLQVEHAKN